MVALLVIFTVIACLVVDSIVVSLREKRASMVWEKEAKPVIPMAFAQDGGEPIDSESVKNREIPWDEVKVDSEEGGKRE